MNTVIYLDNAATTKPCVEAINATLTAMEESYFNPSSLYAPGVAVRKAIEEVRSELKNRLSAKEVVFTSGGTEADNLAVFGSLRNAGKRQRVLYSAVEHSAIRAACLSLQDTHEVIALPVSRDGLLDLDAARQLMTNETVLICCMQVNNETGAIQPLEDLITLRNQQCPDALLHVDGVQGFLHLPMRISRGIDSYALSAHKFHGLKGTGALALGERLNLKQRQHGGSQEMGLRPGTENVPGILAMMAAIRAFPLEHEISSVKTVFYQHLLSQVPEISVNGPDPSSPQAASHIINLSFPGVRGQTLMHALEGVGIMVSQGSACSSRSKKPNTVLSAMGKNLETASSAIRFSFSRFTTQEEARYAADVCAREYQALRKFSRR